MKNRSFFQLAWRSFSTEEQNLLLYLSPFQGAINFGEEIISEFFREVTAVFPELTVSQHPDLFEACQRNGWMKRDNQFPLTNMLRLHPGFPGFLKKKAVQLLGQSKMDKLEIAYIQYYHWLGQQLYDMFFYTPPNERQENLDFMALEFENLLAALWLSVKHQRYDFTEIFLVMNTFLFATQRDAERQAITRKLLLRLEHVPESKRDESWKFSFVDIYDSLGATALHLGQYEASEAYFQRALELYQSFSLRETHPKAIRTLYQNLAAAAAFQEKWEASRAFYSKMIDTTEQYEDAEGMADFYLNFGRNLLNLERYEEAYAYFEAALNFYRELNLPDWQGVALKYLGMVKVREKDFDEAPLYFEQALAIFERLDSRLRIAGVYDEYSLMYLGKKEFDKVLDYAKRAMNIYIDAGMEEKEGIAYLNLCSACVGLEEFGQCEDYLRSALDIFLRRRDEGRLKTVIHLAGMLDKYNDSELLPGFLNIILAVYSSEEVAAFLKN